MSIWVRRCGYAAAAAVVLALTPALTPALTSAVPVARADNPPSVDDTVLDVVDSVLSQSQPNPAPAHDPQQPSPPAPSAIPGS
jgi:hypothetical protein